MMLCEIRLGTDSPELVRIRDLSECGIRVATVLPLAEGRHVGVRLLGGGEWLLARVAWQDRGVAGLAFLRAVDLADLYSGVPAYAAARGRGEMAVSSAAIRVAR